MKIEYSTKVGVLMMTVVEILKNDSHMKRTTMKIDAVVFKM